MTDTTAAQQTHWSEWDIAGLHATITAIKEREARFRALVADMMAAQALYYSTSKDDPNKRTRLVASKQLEARVRAELEAATGQQGLEL